MPPSPARRLVVETERVEHTREVFRHSPVPLRLEVLERALPFRWRSEEIALGPVTIALHQYGAAFLAASASVTDVYSVSFPDGASTGEARVGSIDQTIDRRATVLHSPRGPATYRMASGYSGAQILVRGPEMRAALEAMLGHPLKGALHFDPRLSLVSGLGAGLERIVRFVIRESESADGLLSTPLAATRYGDAILTSMLGGGAHGFSGFFGRPEQATGPRAVRRAMEYLEANATSPVRMADVAAAAGVSIRALQIAFLEHRGCSPLTFLRERRLDRAHAMLLAHDDVPIREIARTCGFAHVGRFSARYRERFGVSPRARRARR